VFSSLLAFADYPFAIWRFVAGVACLVLGLWYFYRSHADLGTNWSITLELREGHSLVTRGVYEHVRHPMYAALLLYSLGNALVVTNWIAGPCYGVSMLLLFAFRVGPEEEMMRTRFGAEYDAYRARSKRLVPFVW
jgi:protein-S-isoprenylcysteine O-methyltransferase Ste14